MKGIKKGERSKAFVLDYFTIDSAGIKKVEEMCLKTESSPSDFIKMIQGIKGGLPYTIDISSHGTKSQNINYCYVPDKWEGTYLLTPHWMSLSSVTFIVLACTLPLCKPYRHNDHDDIHEECKNSYRGIKDSHVSFTYPVLLKSNLKKITVKEISSWSGASYHHSRYNFYVNHGKRDFHRSSLEEKNNDVLEMLLERERILKTELDNIQKRITKLR